MPGQSTRSSSSPSTAARSGRGEGATPATRGVIFDIQRFATHDGPGIRTLVFFKGCPLRCWWCQNPEGLSTSKSIGYYGRRCVRSGRCIHSCPSHALSFSGSDLLIDRAACNACALCVEACPSGALSVAGREVDAIGLVREIENDTLLFDNSGGGVTLTGGEPLYQPAFLRELLIQSRERGIHTAIETSGYASTRAFESIIDLVDLFLFDVKLLDDEKHRKYTGVSNGIIKENLTTVVAVKKAGSVILRFPVITGINDTDENVEGFLDFAGRLDGVTEVDLLPYHDVAEKYERLGLRYRMEEHSAPSEEKLSLIKERFEQAGFRVGLRG